MPIQPSLLPRMNRFLARRSVVGIAVICLALQAGVAALDVVTGPDVIAMPFYCLPIAIAAWYCGVTLGALNAVLGAGIALGIEFQEIGTAHPYRIAGDAFVQIVAFFLTALIVARLQRSARAAQRQRRSRIAKPILSGEFEYATIEELTESGGVRRGMKSPA